MTRTRSYLTFALPLAALLACLPASLFAQSAIESRGLQKAEAAAAQKLAKELPGLENHDVLLITLDAVRAEDLKAFGGADRAPTPSLDALAAKSVRFQKAFATSPHRLTALYSLLYSQYPSTLRGLSETSARASLAAQLEGTGRRAWAYFEKRLLASEGEGLGPNVDRFGVRRKWWEFGAAKEKMQKLFATINDTRENEEPLFGWCHLHFTYPPARNHAGVRSDGTPLGHFRASLTFSDQYVASILSSIEKAGRIENTIVIVAGVHGWSERSGGNNFRQDRLDEKSLSIPLMIHVPGLPSRDVNQVVDSCDVLPTVLALLGETPDATVQGRSMVRLLTGDATSWPNCAFAESLPQAGDVFPQTISAVRYGDEFTTHVAKPGEDSAKPGALFEFDTMNAAATQLWAEQPDRRLSLDTASLELAQLRQHLDRREEGALPLARKLIGSPDEDTRLVALRGMVLFGASQDSATLKTFLDHADPRVRALAGAALARIEQSETGLDHALSGIEVGLSDGAALALLEALGKSKMPRALEGLEKVDLSSRTESIRAERMLALARLKSKNAVANLRRFMLAPNANYDRAPFVKTLLELEGKKSAGLLNLMLQHGAVRRDAALLALEALDRFGAKETEKGVAQALLHQSSAVRSRARALLSDWNSHSDYAVRIRGAQRSTADLIISALGFFEDADYIGSPVLPGRRFAKASSVETAPGIGGRPEVFRFPRYDDQAGQIVIVFSASTEGRDVSAQELWMQLHLDGGPKLSPDHLRRAGDFWIATKKVAAGAMSAGLVEASVRVGSSQTRRLQARLLALMIIPAAPSYLPEITINSEGQESPEKLQGQGWLSLDARRHELWFQLEGDAPATSRGFFELRRNDGVVIQTFQLPPQTREGRVGLRFPRPPRPKETYRLIAIPRGGKLPALRALVFGTQTP